MKSPCAIAVVAVLRFKCPLAAAERDFDAAFASSEGSPAASGARRAVQCAGAAASGDESSRVLLLADIRGIFAERDLA